MAENSWDYLVKAWIEYWGKRRPPQPITFQENEVVVRGNGFRVGDFTGAVYLNVDPNVFTVLTTSDGNLLQVPGGYNRLEPGFYLRHYVDKRTRTITLEKVTATTLDGAMTSITLTISYNVTDPIRVMKLSQPVETLLTLVRIDAGEYIKKHTHDQIVSNENLAGTAKDSIQQYILQQHSAHHAVNRVFAITDVDPQPQGDQKLMGIRLEDRQSTAKLELDHKIQGLEQKIAEKEAEIKKYIAHINADRGRIEAQASAEYQKIQAAVEAEIQAQRIELDQKRRDLQYKQDILMNAMDAFTQRLSNPTLPITPQELGAFRDTVADMLTKGSDTIARPGPAFDAKSPTSPPPTTAEYSKTETLTNILRNLLRRGPGQ